MRHLFSTRYAIAASLLLAALLSFSFTMFHHGWANYDQTKPLDVTGEIIETGYENPHGMITLKTEDETWQVVLAPPYRMQNRGLSQDMLKKGATATVVGYPHKEEAGEMRAERITIDGKTTELR